MNSGTEYCPLHAELVLWMCFNDLSGDECVDSWREVLLAQCRQTGSIFFPMLFTMISGKSLKLPELPQPVPPMRDGFDFRNWVTSSHVPHQRGGGQREIDPTSLEAAADTMETIWDLVCQRDEDALLGFFPDHVLDQAAQLRYIMERGDSPESASSSSAPITSTPQPQPSAQPAKSQSLPQPPPNYPDSRHVTLRDVVQQAPGMMGFNFDSFATRHLYVSPPTRGSVKRLSCMRTGLDRAVLRYAVAVEDGERAVLTFGLECEERLAPQYRSARVEYVWQLVSGTGENMGLEVSEFGTAAAAAAAGTSPTASKASDDDDNEEEEAHSMGDGDADVEGRGPHPSLPPEAVIGIQLAALACEDISRVFAFASPANKAVTGPLERFTMLLLRDPKYRPLVRHRVAEQVDLGSLRPGIHRAVVKVVSTNTGMPQEVEMMFYWVLSRQGPDAGPQANCWMTDSVELVHARTLK
ncbi:hypothetical protein VOLCADRAFT_118965 [Volvox carteri f. nagariensis]|uniref:Uncharacterized protein n=1 Tax=Volvox carteri f. nagariensis TaxID=3068 RepID=D8U908_VOLCA|nr:uncharacterized protein VOLCADRAFT_118965 [Volvox carteri f. nagariensis]EFJ43901.1 hypothetical protein VOLCADRAFT_118965 [Volvox carteri f. nagariensis]|eukprot:XP_002955147.1 hypothetical protein VOLCADRAFT_118965 [Volvox carteri f. nagariensis]